MFEMVYQGKYYCYSYSKRTKEYHLICKRFKSSLILSGTDAIFFKKHINIIKNKPKHIREKLIEKTIALHLYFTMYWQLLEDGVEI
jgi:hypothetical protein